MSSVDQIKSKIDIVSLISSYIKLDKAGTNFKGRCPFHNEKTPSFFVSPDRGTYYCFGCQAKGDIFTFVQEFEGLDFIGSLKVLAERAGVVLDEHNISEKNEKQKLYSLMEEAVLFYQKKLQSNKQASEYLYSRGINDESINNFRIGYSSLEWRDLFDYFIDKGTEIKDLLSVGLIKQKEGTNSYYDTFRGRIMFPISDSSGRVVGFSGRILLSDDKSPKYLNSPETVLFNKSEILFGLDKAKKDIKIKDYSILVEGQMDLVMMHQVGITNTVASSGTALTQNHLIKLRRLSNRIIMSYDGDSAGFSASNKSGQMALSLGMELKLALMPKGQDPADLAKNNVGELKDYLRKSKHIIDFYTDSLISQNLENRKLGQEIQKNVLPYVSLLNSTIEKSYFIKSISNKTKIKEEALWEDLKKIESNIPFSKDEIDKNVMKNRLGLIEKRVLGIINWQKNLNSNLINIVSAEERLKEIMKDKMNDVLENFKKDKEAIIFEVESYYSGKENLEKELEYLILNLEEEYLKQKFSSAMINLQRAEKEKKEEDISKYLEECQEISKQINIIKTKIN